MNMKPIIDSKVAALAVSLLLIGCHQNELELIQSYPVQDTMGFFSSDLQWEKSEDQGSLIHGLSFMFTSDNTSFSRSYASDEEASRNFQQLPEGDYDITVTVNMTDSDGYVVNGIPNGQYVTVSLRDSSKWLEQAWYGVSGATITENEISIAGFTLQRLLSTLKLDVKGLPAGSKLSFSIDSVARSINLTAVDSKGRYGIPSVESFGTVFLDTIAFTEAGKQSVRYNLFPTAYGLDSCLVCISVLTSTGAYLYETAIPRMDVGKSYKLSVDFNDFEPYELKVPLTFEAVIPGAGVSFDINTGVAQNPVYYRCFTAAGWSEWAPYTSGHQLVLENVSDKVQFKGDNEVYGGRIGFQGRSRFYITEDCYVYGNVMSLVDSEYYFTRDSLTGGYNFVLLFKDCDHLLTHDSKRLALPATKLANDCYYGMFEGCSSMTVAPELPAQTLERWCYAYMFEGCYNLTVAPVLPGKTLFNYSYCGMFACCKKLVNIVCLATDISGEYCTDDWLYEAGIDVSGTKTITVMPGVPWAENSDSGIPEGWTRLYYE